jgi:hypothetical protein
MAAHHLVLVELVAALHKRRRNQHALYSEGVHQRWTQRGSWRPLPPLASREPLWQSAGH